MLKKTGIRGILLSVVLIFLPAIGYCADQSVVFDLVYKLENYGADTTNEFLLLVAVGLATLVSEDLAAVAAGLLASKAIISPLGAVAASALGIYIGDILLYLSGYLVGISALHRAPLKWFLSEETVTKCKLLFERRGVAIIVSSRFLPGTRTATFFSAGLARMNPTKLLLVFGISVLIWTPFLVLGAMMAGDLMAKYVQIYSNYAIWIFLITVVLLLFITRFITPLFTWRGRRLLVSRWKRVTKWQFWPTYLINSITIFHILYLGFIKYRIPTLFTITNPAIKPDSGFLRQSSSLILSQLSCDQVNRWKFVEAGLSFEEKRNRLHSFLEENSLDYPILVKPDYTKAAQNIQICRSEEDAARWLQQIAENYIMMELIPGDEFSLCYCRFPDQLQGKILSITTKKMVCLTGDGELTLEELILTDDRALIRAPFYFRVYESQLLRIIPEGERIELDPQGGHQNSPATGTIYSDANSLISPELTRSINKIIQPLHGFYFGTIHLRAESAASLKDGEKFKVSEINGITSLPIHIYDSKHPLYFGWKTVAKEWSLIFRIAKINHEKGCTPITLRSFLSYLSSNRLKTTN